MHTAEQLPLVCSKGDNDAEMLQLAAVGVAMNNAKPKAKAAADITIEVMKRYYFRFCAFVSIFLPPSLQWTNDEDGVAMQLQRMKGEGAFNFISKDNHNGFST